MAWCLLRARAGVLACWRVLARAGVLAHVRAGVLAYLLQCIVMWIHAWKFNENDSHLYSYPQVIHSFVHSLINLWITCG
jgi:hypothetical protein